MNENNIDMTWGIKKAEELLNKGKTVLYFADKVNVIGIIAVSDTIKETSKDAVRFLKNMGIKVNMITGDNEKVAKQIGETVRNR